MKKDHKSNPPDLPLWRAGRIFNCWLIVIIIFGCMLSAGCSKKNPAAPQPVTIVDTVYVQTIYSDAALDGDIWKVFNDDFITRRRVVLSANTVLRIGDWYDMYQMCGEDYSRCFVSFDISGVSDSILTAQVQLHQSYCAGDPFASLGFYCVLDHVTYGDTLDSLDWTAGDSGDPRTIARQFVAISATADTGWETADITARVIADKAAGRDKTQLRIRWYLTDQDNDNLDDYLMFESGNAASNKPRLIVTTKHPLK